MAETFVVDQTAAEDAASTVGLGEGDLYHSACHVDHRHHRDPAQPALSLATDINQPLIVASTDGLLDFRFGSQWAKKQRRIKNLNVDIQLVHVLETAFNIAHLPNRLGQTTIDIDTAVKYSPVEEPVLRTTAARCHQKRPVFVVLDVIPSPLALDHVRIGIDSRHDLHLHLHE